VYWRPAFSASSFSSDRIEDVAILELREQPHTFQQALSLLPAQTLWGHPFRAFGFPGGYDEGVWASGVIRDQRADGWVQIEDVKLPGYAVIQGFSGTPVWDERLEGVVGMVVEADSQAETKAAYIIPTSTLVQVQPEDAVTFFRAQGILRNRHADTRGECFVWVSSAHIAFAGWYDS
jgi:S1-C subfamily serine protease